jgi:hypothetical protein
MDCARNEWSDDLFEKLGYCFAEEQKPIEYSRETKLQMIDALERLDTEASRELLQQLQDELSLKKE